MACAGYPAEDPGSSCGAKCPGGGTREPARRGQRRRHRSGQLCLSRCGPRLAILDISNPAQPVLTGQSAALPRIVRDFAIVGSYAYIADDVAGLWVLDISNPAAIVQVASYATLGSASGIALSGNYAYIADGGDGLRVVAITNPAHPKKLDFTIRQAMPSMWRWRQLCLCRR